MDRHFTYLLINAAAICFPLLLSFDKKVAFYKQWKHLVWGIFFTGAFFVFWDAIFTRQGIWSFNEAYITGFKIAGLPIEEWLFFITVPYCCVFIYECLLRYFSFNKHAVIAWKIFLVTGILLLLVAMVFYERAYTVFAFGGCGLALQLFYFFRKKMRGFRANTFLWMYAISLAPFLIVNGILTAIPVVLYNDAENLGIRIFTIPFEDVFYGMLLMLGNVGVMEWRRGNSAMMERRSL